MTQADLQWLRSEMERVIELNEKGETRPWKYSDCDHVVYGPITGHCEYCAYNPLVCEVGSLRSPKPIEGALIVAAVNYSAAWARHVIRMIERAEGCSCCHGTGDWMTFLGLEDCPDVRCAQDRALLSALIADMRKDGGK